MPNISDLAPEPADCGTVIIRGPQGEPGEQGEPGSTALLVNDPVTADGTGTESDPYVIGLGLSTDADNNLSLGGDGGLYAPVPDGSETILVAGPGVEVAGAGTATDPYTVTSTLTAADLGAVTSVTGADGVTAVTTGTDVAVSADISTTSGNQLAIDATDGGLYVAAQTSVGDNTYVIGDGLEQTGTGTEADPYVLSADLSGDAGNALVFGADGGLYSPASTAGGVTSVTPADDTVTVSPTTGDVTVAANLSADAGNTLATGTDGGLYVPAYEPPDLVWGAAFRSTSMVTNTTTGFQAVPLALGAAGGGVVLGDNKGLTVPVAGWYEVVATIMFQSDTAQARMSIGIDPAWQGTYGTVNTALATGASYMANVTTMASCTAGQEILLRADTYNISAEIIRATMFVRLVVPE